MKTAKSSSAAKYHRRLQVSQVNVLLWPWQLCPQSVTKASSQQSRYSDKAGQPDYLF